MDVGDSGPGVKVLQVLLGATPTAVFDKQTRRAVDEFQREQGWAPSGVGPMTWERIDNHEGAPGRRPNLVKGSRGPGVALLQRILGVPETYYFGPATRAAVDAFQRKQGWKPSGVGPMTWERLDASRRGPISDAPGHRRAYTPAEYEAMWEQEQGRPLTHAEKDTIRRGCIGITANNLHGGGMPPLDEAYSTFEQAYRTMKARNAVYDWMRQNPANIVPAGRYVMFGKLFWSNQSLDPNKRKRSAPRAFRPDPSTGRVDMSGYAYQEQPGYTNYDYGFWDESTNSFWHANHMEYGDPTDQMRVFQSTKDKFAKRINVGGETRYGYPDFDRAVFVVALAENYDPRRAALAHASPAPSPAPVP
jgi:peptidoglycan hydrolase-like protein with peptidoglycan-binding domain